VMSEIRGHPLSTLKNIDGGPPCEVLSEIWERPPSMLKMSTVNTLGGAVGDPGVPTINAKNVDYEPLGR
jgi:hypothetical protein